MEPWQREDISSGTHAMLLHDNPLSSERETARQWHLLPIAGRMLRRREPFASWMSEDSSPSITWPLERCIVLPPSSEYLRSGDDDGNWLLLKQDAHCSVGERVGTK